MDWTNVDTVMRAGDGRVFPAAQLEVRWRGEVVFSHAYGWLDPDARLRPVQLDTLFDLASVTKLFVITCFMTLVEQGVVGLDETVSRVLPEFAGQRPIRAYEDPFQEGAWVDVAPSGSPETIDASQVTFRRLLAHNSGLPAWRPLWKTGSAEAARAMALGTYFSYPPGQRTIYSDIGLILLGLAIERLAGMPLDEAVRRRVTEPAGLPHTRFLPIGRASPVENVAPTEVCAWRKRRIVGEVHDENAAGLGGVAGHAGLFSTAPDVAAFGQVFLNGGHPLLRPATVAEMTRLQSQDGDVRRGLGFALWSPDPEASGNPFSPRAFGHTGFTGTSLWIDPDRALVVACLTNDVYNGRQGRQIAAFRVALHQTVVNVVDSRE